MNILKDSAILNLRDFNRIKKSINFPLLTNSTPIHKYSLTPMRDNEKKLQKALEHRQLLMDYDEKKVEYEKKREFETSKIGERYPGVSHDDWAVRAIDEICRYAKITTVIDKQLKEKKEIENMYKKKEEKLDLMVEIERLKGLKNQEDKERNLQKMKEDGKRVILEQIEDNKKAKIKQKESEEKERIALLNLIEQQQKKEDELNQIKKKEAEKRIQESIEANRKAILDKKQRILEEIEEDIKIERYNKEKYRKEEEALKEKKRLEYEKEMKLQKLREKQEKAQDNRELLDEIRAKRAFEEANKKERLRQKEEMMLKEKKFKDLIEANNKQKLDREMLLAEEAKKEKEEFGRIIREYQKEIEENKRKEIIRKQKLMEHNANLKRQIADKEEREKLHKREILEEGRINQQKLDQYQKSIEALKNDRIQNLRKLKIDEKYILPLKKFNLKDLNKH